MSKPWTLEIKVTKSLTKSDMTIYLSPSIVDCHCIARLKSINHFQRTRLKTPLIDKHYSVYSELLIHSRKWKQHPGVTVHQELVIFNNFVHSKVSLTLAFSSRPPRVKIIPFYGRLPFSFN